MRIGLDPIPTSHAQLSLAVRGVLCTSKLDTSDSVRDLDRWNARTKEGGGGRKIGLTISNIGRVSRKRPPEKVVCVLFRALGVSPSPTVIGHVFRTAKDGRTVYFSYRYLDYVTTEKRALRERENARQRENLAREVFHPR